MELPLVNQIDLPIDILRLIALDCPEVYLAIVCTCKKIQYDYDYITRYFTRPRAVGNTHVYCMPNGTLHVPLDESIPSITTSNKLLWYYNGNRHRSSRSVNSIDFAGNDLPATIRYYSDPRDVYSQKWYQHGLLHRDGDKPARVKPGNRKVWYQHGKIHRDGDKPAVKTCNRKEWRVNGLLHRDNDLPAIVWIGRSSEWYQHGERHRENDLPAIADKSNQEWYYRGKPHRAGGKPAFIYGSTIKWYYHGKLHRINGPAVIDDIISVWYFHGTRICDERS